MSDDRNLEDWGTTFSFYLIITTIDRNRKLLKFEIENITMTNIEIDNKKYVLLPRKEYTELLKKAALKTKPEKLLSVESARAYSKKLIYRWAAEK